MLRLPLHIKLKSTFMNNETLPTDDLVKKEPVVQTKAVSQAALTDTDRINALFTLFGGAFAFSPFWRIQDQFRDGRRGLDKFILENTALTERPSYTCPRGVDETTVQP